MPDLASGVSVKQLRLRFETAKTPAQTPAQYLAAQQQNRHSKSTTTSFQSQVAGQVAARHNLITQAAIVGERRRRESSIIVSQTAGQDDWEMQELESWLSESEPIWIDILLKDDDNDDGNNAESFHVGHDFEQALKNPQDEAALNASVLKFFFENHDPKRVGEVDALLEQNKGREEAFFVELSYQYPEPGIAYSFLVVQQEQAPSAVSAAAPSSSFSQSTSNNDNNSVNNSAKRRPSFITSGIRRQSGWQVNLSDLQSATSPLP